MADVVVTLAGGLGNQLFQTAYAKNLEARGHRVTLDGTVVRWTRGLHIDPQICGLKILNATPPAPVPGRLAATVLRRALATRLRFGPDGRIVRTQRTLEFDEQYLNLNSPGRYRVEGYWQCERYFSDVGQTVRKVFLDMLGRHVSYNGLSRLPAMADPSSISLHVRRGDYVTANFIDPLALEYYERALEELAVPSPRIFVFSDDLDWATRELGRICDVIPVEPDWTSHPGGEIFLMSQCSHHIIANSSFSWWGAWLDGRTSSRVVAPRQWFSLETYSARDIVPDRWTKV
ncbi:alpha-1,2-fucosyltransferase [Smaragdicoccus niigatensis]|uniref:alpha-1,2-fucosyltransferase n=1 Tax=Smaragdicoccus niigatensis TaxID=359359 RepID=UPI0003808DAB|nr:alpha-1,2-fucosyltransferase [Smaragdicoccus niigatensis]